MDETTPTQPRTVARMFGRIAARYDLLNTLMTFGMDADWRRRAVAAAAPPPDGRALDVGTGTGSLALALAAAMPRGRVVGVDFTAPMVARAPGRAAAAGLAGQLTVALADGLSLPFADGTAAYTYLPESVDRFPSPEALAEIMRGAGLTGVRYELLGFGTVALHV